MAGSEVVTAYEITATQAWIVADRWGWALPARLAITPPFADPGDKTRVTDTCLTELAELGLLGADGTPDAGFTEVLSVVSRPRQWLEWLTVAGPDRRLRAVLARRADDPFSAVAVLRYAQMVTFTAIEVPYSGAWPAVLCSGLDPQPPASLTEFCMPLAAGVALDAAVATGTDLHDALSDVGADPDQADILLTAYTGGRVTVEITAGDASTGIRHTTNLSVNIINTDAGRLCAHPQPEHPGDHDGGEVTVFAPGDDHTIAAAVNELTARLPAGAWFPDENPTW